jgi:MFS family permease
VGTFESVRGTPARGGAFWCAVGVFFLLFVAAGTPSPLYGVYQMHWRFSTTTLTAVFAVYALVLLATLLVFGSLSDYLGRRGMIIAALAIGAASCGAFLLAHGVGLLFAARAMQGVAVGLAASALGAALIELQPPRSGLGPLLSISAPNLGLAVGALATSALVQYAPAPTHLVWSLLLGAFVLAVFAVMAALGPGDRRPGALASLRPRVSVPRAARASFISGLPCFIAVWALGGLYLSLGPSIAAGLVASHNLLWGGVAVCLLSGSAGLTPILFASATPAKMMVGGSLTLLAGVAVTFVAIATSTAPTFLAGTALSGVGFGLAFVGAYRATVAHAAADELAGLIAAIYVVSYVAFSVPVVLAGLASTRFGLHDTALVYSAAVAILVAFAAGNFIWRAGTSSDVPLTAGTQVDGPPGPCTVPPSFSR